MKHITLNDVASQAGVSKKTVSRVLNNEPNVAPKTFQRVRQTIAELNYVPNTAARRLSSGRARTIGIILGWQIFTPYTSKLVEGAFRESNRHGYSISLFPMENGSTDQIIEAFRGKQVDGFILDTFSDKAKNLGEGLTEHQIPHVVVNPNSKKTFPNASFVRIDDEQAAQTGAGYLIQLGHRQIGFIAVDNGMIYPDDRINGYKKALSRGGIPYREELVIKGESYPETYEVGYHNGLKLIQQHPEITAVFGVTDNVAMGIMQAIWHLGLKIPEDISVLGFDDNYYAAMTAPSLTTIHQPIVELASQAVQLLIQNFKAPSQKAMEVTLPTNLVIRSSCAPPRQTG